MHSSQRHVRKPSPTAPSRVVVLAVAVAIGLIAVAASARAQGRNRSLALSVFGGYNIASDIYTDIAGAGSLEFKNGFMWGGRATAFSSEYSAFEFAYSRTSADLEVRTGTIGNTAGFDAGSMASDEYDFNFLVSQPAGNPKMWPHFTLGFGWTMTHPDIRPPSPVNNKPVPEGNSLFAWNFGLGTMVEMNPKLALRLDARWRVTDTHITTSSGVYCDYWGYCWGYASDWYNSGELTAGLSYRLGQ